MSVLIRSLSGAVLAVVGVGAVVSGVGADTDFAQCALVAVGVTLVMLADLLSRPLASRHHLRHAGSTRRNRGRPGRFRRSVDRP
jgi:hypothetical protein